MVVRGEISFKKLSGENTYVKLSREFIFFVNNRCVNSTFSAMNDSYSMMNGKLTKKLGKIFKIYCAFVSVPVVLIKFLHQNPNYFMKKFFYHHWTATFLVVVLFGFNPPTV